MKVSIITPTNNPCYLPELYQSILSQTYTNWEWIILINGNITRADIPDTIKSDSRIFVSHLDHILVRDDLKYLRNIGLIKHYAFNLGTGEVLLEADHDDILTPNCLECVVREFNRDPAVGFVYSNNAKLSENFLPYNISHGWRHSKFTYKEQELWAPQCFAATSHSLGFIWYSPDHVRAWRASVYQELGGHNKTYNVLDDQELLIRTYLVTKFKQIKETLYIYRIDGLNTWLQRNQQIQQGTVRLFEKYALVLAERDAVLNNKLLVELGGGVFPREGYINIDTQHGDIKADLNLEWPLETNSVGVIRANHILEHLKDTRFSMKEIHRVLHHGGWAFIEVPSTDGRGAWQDPTHISYWNENSFLYYTHREQAFYINNTDVRFQSYKVDTIYPNSWYEQHKILVTRAWLVSVKDTPRFPGLLNI
jgi:hypothetical protein